MFSRLVTAMKMAGSSEPLISNIGKALSLKPLGGFVGGAMGGAVGSAISDGNFEAIAGGALTGGALGLATSGVRLGAYANGSFQDMCPDDIKVDLKYTGKYAIVADAKILGMPVGTYGQWGEYQAGEVINEGKETAYFKNIGLKTPLF